MADRKWTWSDKLAIALTCLAGILALILLWMDKTPVWAGFTVVLMAALVFHPVIHFVPSWRARFPSLIVAWALIGLFGWRIWPHPSATSNPGRPTPVPTQIAPPNEPVATPPRLVPTPKLKAKPPQPISPNSILQQNSGGVNVQQATTGPNSPIINSPITVNPGPPPPTITICISDPQTVEHSREPFPGEVKQVLTLTTSSEVTGPAYALEFSGEILKSTYVGSPDMATNMGEKLAAPNVFSFGLFQTWFPGQRINVEVHSIGPVSLTKESSKLPNATFITKNGECNSGW